jgi:PIN domain nuclease of toxin-antitoxin system
VSAAARAAIVDPENQAYLSAASVWEISIKAALGRFPATPDFAAAIRKDRFLPLDITMAHAAAAGALPLHHRDPFDRMLIAQAQIEGIVIVSRDRRLAPYDVPILWA